jgi:hypothetical protein
LQGAFLLPWGGAAAAEDAVGTDAIPAACNPQALGLRFGTAAAAAARVRRGKTFSLGLAATAAGRAAVCICAHFHRPDSRRNRSVRLEKITEPLLGSRHDAHHADARPPCPLLDFRKRCLLCLRASSSSPLGATISAQIGDFVPRHSTG